MDDYCETCGQRLSDLHVEGDSGRAHHHSPAPGPGASRTGVVLTLLAIAILGAVVIAVAALATTSDDPVSDDPVSEDADFDDADFGDADFAPDDGAADDIGQDGALTSARRVAGNADELQRLIGDHTLAYVGDDTVVVVDPAASIVVSQLVPADSTIPDYIFRLTDFELLLSGADVFGLLPGSDEAVELSTAGSIVRDADGGFAIVVSREGSPTELHMSGGAHMDLSLLTVPPGAGRLDVQDVGVLVTPVSGGTYVARPTRFDLFAEGLVLAATPTHHLEAACDEALDCAVVLVDRGADTRDPLSLGFHGEQTFALSPGARWILVEPADGATLLYDGEERTVHELPIAVPSDAAWASDDSVVVWFAPGTDRPILQVFAPATRTLESIDLAELRAVSRTSDAIALLPAPG